MIYFTSDWHLGCDKLVENTRTCFRSVEEHNDEIIHQTNLRVCRDDMLVIIGDFCKEKPGRYRHRIRCKQIHFILGNHDNEAKTRKAFGGNVWHGRMVRAKHGKVWCEHTPVAFWDQCFRGTYHAYGHLHNDPWREMMLDIGMPERRSMDIGIDHAYEILGEYRPFTEEEFFFLLKNRIGHDIVKER